MFSLDYESKALFYGLLIVFCLMPQQQANASSEKLKFSRIAIGDHHAIALKSDGTLWAWGANGYGQLGDGTTGDKSSPIQIGTDNKWVSIAVGFYHTIALKSDGTLWAWGVNGGGQLGDGTTIDKHSPVQIGTDNNWIFISVRGNHTVVLKSDGTLWAWGANGYGQLGDGTTVSKSSPIQIGTDNKWASISAGDYHTVALKSDGTLWAWGENTVGQLGDGTTIDKSSPVQIGTDNKWISITAKNAHTIALKSNGTLWAWGLNGNGQLGDGTLINKTSPVQTGTDNKWVSIAVGSAHTIALKSDGTLWAWGHNSIGQLGDGTTADQSSPVQIGIDNKWISISVGDNTTIALKSDGALWAWGLNDAGQLGDGTTVDKSVPVQVSNNHKWFSVSTGRYHTITLKSDGTLWSWGLNDNGQLGDGTTINKSAPVQIGLDNKWIISAGWYHTIVLKSDGTLWAWGDNAFGQLGDGTTTDKSSPVQIGMDNTWVSIAAKGYHTIALKSDGTLWAWGRNDFGQLGDGTTANKSAPVQIGSDNKWVSIAVGWIHTIALKSDGTLWAWGNNAEGQVGDGTTVNKYLPVQIGTDNKWVSIAPGESHTIALKSDGTLWAWGYNFHNELGDGTTVNKSAPVQIGLDNTWVIAAGGHAALKSNGTLWGWGDNTDGQVGDGTTVRKVSPVQIGADNKWVSMSGEGHTVALKSDGTLWAWGYNGFGELGDGTIISKSAPVQIQLSASNNAPTLVWTSETNYTADGLNPETGDTATVFVYRVKYTDGDNDAPLSGYPKVHIKKGGSEISGSPFTMMAVDAGDTTYSDGKLYTYSKTLTTVGTDYTYYFEAQDIYAAVAAGAPASAIDSPDVSNIQATPLNPSFTARNDSSLTASWTIVSGVNYVAVLTSDSGYSSIISSVTQSGNTKTFSGLSTDTTYYFEVKLSTETDAAFALNRISTTTTHPPVLSWTAETNYTADGLNPETGDASAIFIYRIKYMDIDNDAPLSGYPKVHIKKGGSEISGSPFTMTAVDAGDTTYSDGKLYTYSKTLTTVGTDYTYYFEAQDIYAAAATGAPTSAIDAPDVTAVNNPPTLAWTGETNYTAGGINPETGDTSTTFVYRMKYIDADNDPPAGDYPKLSITQQSIPPVSMMFTMIAVDAGDNTYTDGKLYSYSITLSPVGTDYIYSFQAQDINGAMATGTPTYVIDAPDVVALADSTPPAGAPSTPQDQGVFINTTTISFSWTQGTAGDNESGIAGYYLQIGINPAINDASLFDGDAGNVLTKIVTSGSDGKTYYARVRAKNGAGLCGSWSNWSDGIGVDITPPGVPVLTSNSHPDSNQAYPDPTADISISGPADFSGIAGYYYKIDAVTNTVPSASDTFTANTSVTTGIIQDGTWYFHALAKDGAGSIGTSAAHYKFQVLTAINPAVNNIRQSPDGTKVEVPAGAITSATQIIMETSANPPAVVNDPAIKATSVARDIKLADGTSWLNKAIIVTLPYTANDIAGINENSLRLFFYDATQSLWKLTENSAVDAAAKRVTGNVTHLTLFRIMGFSTSGTVSDNLSNYPNPFSPLRGQTTKIRYSLDQSKDVKIRIYNPFGRLIWEKSFSAGQNGGSLGPNEITWDGKDGDGNFVKAGAYICVIESGGAKKTTKIVAK